MKSNLCLVGLICLILLINDGFCLTSGSTDGPPRIVYSPAELCTIGANYSKSNRPIQLNLYYIPKDIKRRKRGRASGVRKRLHSQKNKPYLPSLIIGNVQSINNKTDELAANVSYFQEYRNVSIMSFTETWLGDLDRDDHVDIQGFKLIRGDRILENTNKTKGGGLCVYVNEQWCHPNNVILKRHSCTPNLEILTVSLRPYYLPREFSHVIHSTIYIPDKSVVKPAEKELFSAIQDLERNSPNALFIIDGDFNHGSLKNCTSQYYQHVTCTTRGNATLDYCYSNVKDAYVCKQEPKLGKSDHNLVLLSPKYRPLVQRQQPRTMAIKQWSDEAVQELQASLECTDWDVFMDANPELNEFTETVSCYINFCVESIIPIKVVKVYPNNKPWITKRVKDVINQKKQAFGQGDKTKLKEVQKKLKQTIKIEKQAYRSKLEQKFTENNMKQVWDGLKLISGYSKSSTSKSFLPETTVEYANDLNVFYNRFDKNDFRNEINSLHTTLKNMLMIDDGPILQVSNDDVCCEFKKLNTTKSAGPDNITPRILKLCAEQLAEIFTFIFNWSFRTQVVPGIWKRSCIIPIAKKSVISCMNDLRPVALTSIPMKVCERLFKNALFDYIQDYIDPLQFAYRSKRSCTDAILFMLENMYLHCDGARFGNSVRTMFFDFSSAFNTIQPHLLIQKLLDHRGVPCSFMTWILDYLTNRSQYVRFTCNGTISNMITSNTGAPQGTVLAPFLFTIYTSDFKSTDPSCPIIKFADDSAMIALITDDDDTVFHQQLDRFVNYCDANYLELNVSKTKEMIIDFRNSSSIPNSVNLKGSSVERVTSYKYLGIMIDDKLNWHMHIDSMVKKLNSRMYCFRKLKFFHVNSHILGLFYDSVVKSIWGYCLLCWGGNVSQRDRERVERVIKEAGNIIGSPREKFETVYTDLVMKKLTDVMEDPNHPLHHRLSQHIIPRSGRMRLPPAKTKRYLLSFVALCPTSNQFA